MASQDDAGGESSHYTHLLIGTSLTLSTLSAALSQSESNRVLHVDPADYYGSFNASLTLTQLVKEIQKRQSRHDNDQDLLSSSITYPLPANICFPYFDDDQCPTPDALSSSPSPSSFTVPASLQSLDRHYSLSLSPALQPATSPSLDILIRSQVARYATFRLLQRTAVWDQQSSGLRTVPASKEDVFKSGDLSLIEKRKLMKFLQFAATYDPLAAGESGTFKDFLARKFTLPPHLITAIMYGIALCSSEQEGIPVAMERLKTHLASVGKYGNSAYLVPQYGGAGEIAQGYCRAAAVHGATFILGKDIENLEEEIEGEEYRYKLKLQGIEEVFTADTVIGEEELVNQIRRTTSVAAGGKPETNTAQRLLQGLLVLDRSVRIPVPSVAASSSSSSLPGSAPSAGTPQVEEEIPLETGLIVFPPRSLLLEEASFNECTVTALILGEGTFCCPKGQYVVHLTTEIPADSKGGDLSQLVSQTLAAAKAKIVDFARDSPVEWRPKEEGSNQTQTHPGIIRPLIEAYWLEAGPRHSTSLSRHAASSQIITVPRHHLTPTSEGTSLPLTTLLNTSAEQSVHLFYTIVHGIQPPYPTVEGWLKRKRGSARTSAEFKGRGGVGPSDLEGEEAEETEGGEGREEVEKKEESVFLFPPVLDDADAGVEDDE